MEIVQGWHDVGAHQRGATAVLGNFDGVHRGHQALLGAARAAVPSAPLAVISFEPHPRRFFQPLAPSFRLTAASERRRVLAKLGVSRLYELTFDRALAGMDPEAFARDVLAAGLGLRHVVVGSDFRFGKGRAGSAEMLATFGAAHGFGVGIEPMLGSGSAAFSSTQIRDALRRGLPREAARALGRWHGVSGIVVEGDRRGRDLGYPTANLVFGEQLVPAYGVYATRVEVHDGPHAGSYDGVASLGERPTFGVNAPNCEVHVFDFSGDLYGAEITVSLVAFLRGELRFDSAGELIAQMDTDSAEAQAALRTAGRPWADPLAPGDDDAEEAAR